MQDHPDFCSNLLYQLFLPVASSFMPQLYFSLYAPWTSWLPFPDTVASTCNFISRCIWHSWSYSVVIFCIQTFLDLSTYNFFLNSVFICASLSPPFINLFIHSFIQQTFIEYQLCARNWNCHFLLFSHNWITVLSHHSYQIINS